MNERISVGDLVVVVRACCDAHLYGLGYTFTVVKIRPRIDKFQACKECGYSAAELVAEADGAYRTPGQRVHISPLSFLKRIPPLAELESERTESKEPACTT